MQFTLDQAAIDSVFNLPRNDGTFLTSQRVYLQALSSKRQTVFLAFPPKAAGTFLRICAVKAVDGELVRSVHAQGGRDAQPYLPTFISYHRGGICAGPFITHVHMQALPANRAFIEALNIRPVIMVRSIPDMLASYWDMLEQDEAARLDGLNCIIPSDFPGWSTPRKGDFLVDILGPWYAGYFASWFAYARLEAARVLVLRYGDFVADPCAVLRSILDHSRLTATDAQCRAAIDFVWSARSEWRFNRGETGRGRSYFDAAQIERLGRQLSFYPDSAENCAELLS